MFRRRTSTLFGIRPRILILIPYTLPLIYEVPPSIHNCVEMLISHHEWMYSPKSLKDQLDRGVRVLATPRNPEEELKMRDSRLPTSHFLSYERFTSHFDPIKFRPTQRPILIIHNILTNRMTPLIPHRRLRPKNAVRINTPLNLQQSLIKRPIKALLPILLPSTFSQIAPRTWTNTLPRLLLLLQQTQCSLIAASV
jgi:hypothetical protein